jgi:hypothetical protein
MLKNYNSQINPIYIITVHHDFPKEKLVNILKPCLLLYFKYSYSLIKTVKYNALNSLYKKLKELKIFNPRFGRKIISMGNPSYFDDRHINFNSESPNIFLLSHTNNNYLLENINSYDSYNNHVHYEENNDDENNDEEINIMDDDEYDVDDDSHG